MKMVPYTIFIGSLSYAMLYARPSIYFAMGMVSIDQLNPGLLNLVEVKHIDYMLVHQSEDLIVIGFTNTDF